MKRLFDVVVAASALIALSPVFLLIAAAILVTDPGPVFFRHSRIGRFGQPFPVLKFRTMKQHHTLTSELTISRDPRVTPFGKLLRVSKLDELPQLVNVLRGEMSLVGPRPESPKFVAHYTPAQRAILRVRPGITGPAQIFYPHQERILDGPDYEERYINVVMPIRVALGINYARNHTLWYDFKCILLTLLAIVHPIPPHWALPRTLRNPAKDFDRPLSDDTTSAPDMSLRSMRLAQADATHTAGRPRIRIGAVVLGRMRLSGVGIGCDMIAVITAFESVAILRYANVPLPIDVLGQYIWPSLAIAFTYTIVSYLAGLHQRLWRYANMHDAASLARVVAATALIASAAHLFGLSPFSVLPISVIVGGTLLSFLFLGAVKTFLAARPNIAAGRTNAQTIRVLIIGAGQAGADLSNRFMLNSGSGYQVVAFIDDDPEKWHRRIHGKSIYGPTEAIPDFVRQLGVDMIAIAMPSADPERIEQIAAQCRDTRVNINVLQGLPIVANGHSSNTQ